jgi:hypothetical protein
MRYTVTCPLDLQEKLASIWVKASDRGEVERASNRIDALLRQFPTRGQDHGTHWALTIPPLTVAYTISSDDRQVAILDFDYGR